MSIRRRIALVFLAVVALTLGALLLYLRATARDVRLRFERDRQLIEERTARLLALAIDESIAELEDQLEGALREDDDLSLAIDVSELAWWDEDAVVREHLDRAMLIRYSEAGYLPFNPRRRLIFDDRGEDAVDLDDVRRLIETADALDSARDEAGRMLVWGRIGAEGPRNWGYFFRLKPEDAPSFDPAATFRTIVAVVLPGTLFLLLFLFLFFRRSVLDPLADLERTAREISQGSFEHRLTHHAARRDEIGRVARAMDEMMGDIERYRRHMEGLVEEAAERYRKAQESLVLAQRLAATGRLAAGVAHEVNNPLGGVMNAIRKLERDDLPPERRALFLEVARDGVQRIGEIVRRLLDAAPRRSRPGPVDLGEALRAAGALVQHRLEAERVALVFRIADDLRLLGDRHELIQAFLNLFLNALDAIEDGGRITVRARAEDDVAVVEVEDDGCGMDADLTEQIFDLFFTTKAGGEGSGLGLGIVHGIVSGHGGTIAVESEPGRGTLFTVRLPLAESGDERSTR